MQTQTITVAPRFCGPSRSGNGGYVCGRIAAPLGSAARVRLFAPPPLATELTLQHDGERSALLHGDTLIGEARRSALDLPLPPAPTLEQAVAASAHYSGFVHHSFPNCFVCGPQREQGDGLHIFAGKLDGSAVVASPWLVDASLAVDGVVPGVHIWAALDCPGAFAAVPNFAATPVVLGELDARIERSVSVGQRCVVIGWPLGRDGRKHFAGTAVFDDNGGLIAVARAVWIEVAQGRFE